MRSMRVLIIGGTAFVGRHIAEAALMAGHDVALFHRGNTGNELFPKAVHLTGDRNEDLSALADGRWDVTIDVCGYLPRQIRSLAAALGGRGGRYVYISSVSVYRTPVAPGYDEQAPLVTPSDPAAEQITDQAYGGLKAACERAGAELHHDAGLMIVRPTYVIGPHDYSGRFTWWVERLARGGTVLAPWPSEYPVQVIDARDLGAWIVSCAEHSVSGVYHAVSPAPPFSFGDMLETIAAAVAPPGTELTWVDKDFLLGEGVTESNLPMWPGIDDERDINAADPAAAFAAGLSPRPLSQTVGEIHAHELASPIPRRMAVGLPPEREAELLARWQAGPFR